MAIELSLKTKNAPIVFVFVVWCFTVYYIFQSNPLEFWDKFPVVFKTFNAKDGVIAVLAPILTLVLNGLIASDMKAKLVFLRINNALPGHRVFSELVHRDNRVNIKSLSDKLGGFPTDPVEQNNKWYSIYKKYGNSIIVKQSHGAFLLSRDLCSISFLFALIGSIVLLALGGPLRWVTCYFAIMLVHYGVLAIVAQNHGNRFTCNVLAEYSNDGAGI